MFYMDIYKIYIKLEITFDIYFLFTKEALTITIEVYLIHFLGLDRMARRITKIA